jgi:hypothetical protein
MNVVIGILGAHTFRVALLFLFIIPNVADVRTRVLLENGEHMLFLEWAAPKCYNFYNE